jgi:hypothetical protein
MEGLPVILAKFAKEVERVTSSNCRPASIGAQLRWASLSLGSLMKKKVLVVLSGLLVVLTGLAIYSSMLWPFISALSSS